MPICQLTNRLIEYNNMGQDSCHQKNNDYACFILTPLSKIAPKIKRPAKIKIELLRLPVS